MKPLTLDKKRSVLEVLRTGARTKMVDQELAKHPVDKLFTSNEFKAKRELRRWYNVEGRRAYPATTTVAQKYGLTKKEFEYFFTIASPNGQERVFYSYHVLSRPQAMACGWDWWVMIELCDAMVQNMKSQCNKHAEAAGQD
ncbi:hypothetical protein NW762_009172 [Fusarium torreyae]|uniref:Uncharacterized protein n=1 Tax=Fusarium torreyae TaxID=1237075 RepID=A0A9W8RWT9_9HYPO|nr:hypothetical protein NW762_009172 [Fusarium torreyae]